MSRIFWTDKEWESVALEMYNEDKLNSWAVRTPTDINRAQKKVLPKERRRKVAFKKAFKRLEKEIENIRLRDKVTTPEKEVEAKEKTITDFTTDEIMKELARRYIKPLLINQTTTLVDKIIVEPSKNKIQQSTYTQKNKKIVIVGLISQQVEQIRNSWGDKFRIQFIGSDDNSITQLKMNAKEADHVFIMTRFVGHKHTDAVKSVCQGNKIVMVTGMLSELNSKLEQTWKNSH